MKEKIKKEENTRLNEIEKTLKNSEIFNDYVSRKYWKTHETEINDEVRRNERKTLTEIQKEINIKYPYVAFFQNEKLSLLTEKNRILEQLSDEVQDDVRDISNRIYPEGTDMHIKNLFDQRRYAETETVKSFNLSHPEGPTLPLPEEFCE
jgi:hypothetical protein